MRTYDDITLIGGTAHPELAKALAAEVGRDLAKAHVARFDGEVDIKIDEDLRGRDVFVLQPTCPPVNDNWVELLLRSTPCVAPAPGGSRRSSTTATPGRTARTRARCPSAPRSSPTRWSAPAPSAS